MSGGSLIQDIVVEILLNICTCRTHIKLTRFTSFTFIYMIYWHLCVQYAVVDVLGQICTSALTVCSYLPSALTVCCNRANIYITSSDSVLMICWGLDCHIPGNIW